MNRCSARLSLIPLAGLILSTAIWQPSAATAQPRENKPLWEAGAIGGGGLVPGYPASSESRGRGIGSPYIMYRGKFWRIGEKSIVRGRLAQERNWELDISLDGSFSSDSDDDKARRGMPDLDWLGEVGPRFQYTLARAARDAKIDVELPVRAVFSSDFSDLHFRGFVLAPRLAYQHERFFARHLELKLSVGSTFATTRLADYFYRVEEIYETPTRPRYEANGGYIGSSLNLTLAHPVTRRIKFFILGAANFHHGAANENSPLFKDKTTFGVGGGPCAGQYFNQAAKLTSNPPGCMRSDGFVLAVGRAPAGASWSRGLKRPAVRPVV